MKKFFITVGRERDLIRYSEMSDQKDVKSYSFQEAKKRLLEKSPSYRVDDFLVYVMQWPFNDWIEI